MLRSTLIHTLSDTELLQRIPSNTSTLSYTALTDVEWKRVGELRVAPQLYAGSLYGGLIVRSTTSPVDDGSFLGALGAVATRNELLEGMFSIEQSSDRYGNGSLQPYSLRF